MCYSLNIAELDIKRRLHGIDIHREIRFEQQIAVVPVDFIADIDPIQLCVSRNILADHRMQELSLYEHHGPYRPTLKHFCMGYIAQNPGFFRIIGLHIPSPVLKGTVFINDQPIERLALRRYAAPVRRSIKEAICIASSKVRSKTAYASPEA